MVKSLATTGSSWAQRVDILHMSNTNPCVFSLHSCRCATDIVGRKILWKVSGASLPTSETTVNLFAAMLRR